MLTPLVSSLTNPIPALVPAAWYRGGYGVTGTLTASNWADQSGNGRDLAQGTAGNQPIYLPYSGTPYAYLPGVNSNNFTTPDSASASITSDIDIRVQLALDDWTPTGNMTLVSKWTSTGNKRSYLLQLAGGGNTGKLVAYISQDGTNLIGPAISSVATGITDGATKWVRMTWLNSTNAVQFFTSDDGEAWTQLGTDQSLSATGINDNDAVVSVGGLDGGSSEIPLGKIYRAQIYNGINGTLAVDFNPPDFAETSTNGATATSSTTGEVWTLNSTGAKPAQVVKSASLLGDGTNGWMQTAAFTMNQPCSIYAVVRQITWTNNEKLWSARTANQALLWTLTSTPRIGLYAGSVGTADANLALGSKAIISSVYNGASSFLGINANTGATSDAGAGNFDGLTLFANGDGTGIFNAQAYELIAFAAAHTAAERSLVRNWLNWVHHCY